MPTTVADYDRELEEAKRKFARLKEGRKAAAAKEREQARKWRAATVAAMGELILEALGCVWNEVDLAELGTSLDEWADGCRESIQLRIVAEGRTPAEAKQSLDTFKRARREARKTRPAPSVESGARQAEDSSPEPCGEDVATW